MKKQLCYQSEGALQAGIRTPNNWCAISFILVLVKLSSLLTCKLIIFDIICLLHRFYAETLLPIKTVANTREMGYNSINFEALINLLVAFRGSVFKC